MPEYTTAILKGVQGVLLDEWRGFHPHTTWSTVTLHHALAMVEESNAEEHPGRPRAYMTRHGAGPLPTWSRELDAAFGPREPRERLARGDTSRLVGPGARPMLSKWQVGSWMASLSTAWTTWLISRRKSACATGLLKMRRLSGCRCRPFPGRSRGEGHHILGMCHTCLRTSSSGILRYIVASWCRLSSRAMALPGRIGLHATCGSLSEGMIIPSPQLMYQPPLMLIV